MKTQLGQGLCKDAYDENSGEQEFINRFLSITTLNKPTEKSNSEFSSEKIIADTIAIQAIKAKQHAEAQAEKSGNPIQSKLFSSIFSLNDFNK